MTFLSMLPNQTVSLHIIAKNRIFAHPHYMISVMESMY
jgi:hypothetical protein